MLLLLRNERGQIVIALPLIVLLAVALVWVIRTAQALVSADIILENSVVIAVKAAANQFDTPKPPKGPPENVLPGPPEMPREPEKKLVPRIDFVRARSTFEQMLEDNMELKSNLEPKKHSAFSGQPRYTLLLYNGEGNPSGIRYIFSDGVLTSQEIDTAGFPKTFTLEGVTVEMESPGAAALVGIQGRNIVGETGSYQRWALVRIVKKGNQWLVVRDQ